MRVDLVFPRFKLLSGAERLILGLAGALVDAGRQPRIVCHMFDDSCRPRLPAGVELVCSGKRLDWARNRYLNAISDYARTWQLGRYLDPDADAHVMFGPALPLAWQRKRLTRSSVPLLYFCYEPPRALYQDRQLVLERLGLARIPVAAGLSLYRLLDRRMVRAVDRVCTNSTFAAGRINACYGRDATVITHGVDRERFDAARRPVADGAPRLLTVNYLHPRKRVGLAIEALALLNGKPGRAIAAGSRPGAGVAASSRSGGESQAGQSARLWVVGDGPERQRLEMLAADLGVRDAVDFAGFVADDDLPGYYWAATAYVHTTREESFGLSVIEAAYCGRPVVAVDEGGVRETVADGVTGYRVPASAVDLASALERLLGLPDRGAEMGEAGRQRTMARYSWEQGGRDLVAAVRREAG